MRFRVHHTLDSERDPYDLEGVRIEPTASGYDLVVSKRTQGSTVSRTIREIPRTDVSSIEEAPDTDLSEAIADYRRAARIFIGLPPPAVQQELNRLAEDYRRMQELQGYTEQSRGRRLNGVVAELLRAWEINAIESARGLGEIDVAFELGGTRFILEAKWEQDKLNMHPVFSLRGRVQQRLSGTVGLLLSMSGYTPDTLSQANIGQGPMVLLLDKDHFEAMLFGATSPQKLLKALLDRASFYGEAYTPWSKLVSE